MRSWQLKDKFMKKAILDKNQSYTFSDYFNLAYPTRDIVAELGYQFKQEQLTLPEKPFVDVKFEALENLYYKKLPHIALAEPILRIMTIFLRFLK